MVRAIWQGIYRALRNDIESGTCPFQSFLPSEAQLVERFDCSHNTLRRALSQLREDGFVQPIHGKGIRVIWRPRDRSIFEVGGVETFDESILRLGRHPLTLVPLFERVVADANIATRTGFAEGEELFHLNRVRVFDGEAVIRDENYFLTSIAEGLTPEIAASSIYRYLEHERGVKVAQVQRLITVEPANKTDYELLDIPEGAYLAVVSSQTFDTSGVLFEYTESRHRSDRFIFHEVAHRKVV